MHGSDQDGYLEETQAMGAPVDFAPGGTPTNVILLLEAASSMDALASRARGAAMRALDAEKDYGLMAKRLRALATRESVAEEWEDLVGPEDSLPPL